jgi:hypothetical protein
MPHTNSTPKKLLVLNENRISSSAVAHHILEYIVMQLSATSIVIYLGSAAGKFITFERLLLKKREEKSWAELKIHFF